MSSVEGHNGSIPVWCRDQLPAMNASIVCHRDKFTVDEYWTEFGVSKRPAYTVRETTMRILPLALGVAVGVAALTVRAEAQNYPWCAVFNVGDAAYSCSFVTYEQCRASVSGVGGSCMLNNTYNPAATPRPYWGNR